MSYKLQNQPNDQKIWLEYMEIIGVKLSFLYLTFNLDTKFRIFIICKSEWSYLKRLGMF